MSKHPEHPQNSEQRTRSQTLRRHGAVPTLETGLTVHVALEPPQSRYTIDEAVDLLNRVLVTLDSVENFRLKLKWCLGHLVYYTKYPRNQRGETLKMLSQRLNELRDIPACTTVLYECLALFKYFDGELNGFEAWIAEGKIRYGRQVYWSDVQRDIFGGRSNPRVIGREEADLRDMRAIEQGSEAIDRLVARVHADTDELDDERRGVIAGYIQSAKALALLPHYQREAARSDDYLAFVRSYGCIVCNNSSDAHHAFGPRGLQQKASDFACVPLCRVHHTEIHQKGQYSFQDRHDVDLFEITFNLLHRFVTGSWVTLQLEEVAWTTPVDLVLPTDGDPDAAAVSPTA